MCACKIIFGDRKYIVLHNNVTFIFNLFRKGQCMINRHFKKDKIISIPHIHYYQSQPFLNFGQFLITLACIFTTAVATILFLIPNNIKSTIVWESHPSQAFSTPSTPKKLKKKKPKQANVKEESNSSQHFQDHGSPYITMFGILITKIVSWYIYRHAVWLN